MFYNLLRFKVFITINKFVYMIQFFATIIDIKISLLILFNIFINHYMIQKIKINFFYLNIFQKLLSYIK